MILELSSRPALEEEIKQNRNIVALIPVGSLEQHGMHLPFGTDSIIVTEIARRVEKLTDAILFPTIYYGFSAHHVSFAGTVSIRPENLIGLFSDIISSIAGSGIKKILFLNGHGGKNGGGNTGLLQVAAEEGMIRFPEVRISVVNYWDNLPSEFLKKIDDYHAGYTETSTIMAIDSSLAGKGAKMPNYTDSLFSPENYRLLTQEGSFGNTENVDDKIGKEILEICSKKLSEKINEVYKNG